MKKWDLLLFFTRLFYIFFFLKIKNKIIYCKKNPCKKNPCKVNKQNEQRNIMKTTTATMIPAPENMAFALFFTRLFYFYLKSSLQEKSLQGKQTK
jgi:hypothetical protein